MYIIYMYIYKYIFQYKVVPPSNKLLQFLPNF